MGYDLDRLEAVARRMVADVRSIGVGLASCIIPETGRPNYLIENGTMEIGVGHHGLSSKDTCKLRSRQRHRGYHAGRDPRRYAAGCRKPGRGDDLRPWQHDASAS